MRSQADRTLGRAVAYSNDDGSSWGPITFIKALESPVCQGSTVTFGGVTYFSNPKSSTSRSHLTVQASLDNGQHWNATPSYLIQPGPSAGYSCLVKGEIRAARPGNGERVSRGGILYEGPATGQLSFASFPLTSFGSR